MKNKFEKKFVCMLVFKGNYFVIKSVIVLDLIVIIYNGIY